MNLRINSCIYWFKYINCGLLSIISLFILFNSVSKLSELNSSQTCNLVNTNLLLMFLRVLIDVCYFTYKNYKFDIYLHTDKEGWYYIFLACLTLFNINIIANNICNNFIWKLVPYSYYFIVCYFVFDLFFVIPVCIYHIFLFLIGDKYKSLEETPNNNTNSTDKVLY